MFNPEKGQLFERFHQEVLRAEPRPIEYDSLLKQLERQAKQSPSPELKEQLEWLKRDLLRYLETVTRHASMSRRLEFDPEGWRERVQQLDEARYRTHNVVSDDLNSLSRSFAQVGFDNSWRDRFSSRDAVGEWAIESALGILSREIETEASQSYA